MRRKEESDVGDLKDSASLAELELWRLEPGLSSLPSPSQLWVVIPPTQRSQRGKEDMWEGCGVTGSGSGSSRDPSLSGRVTRDLWPGGSRPLEMTRCLRLAQACLAPLTGLESFCCCRQRNLHFPTWDFSLAHAFLLRAFLDCHCSEWLRCPPPSQI